MQVFSPFTQQVTKKMALPTAIAFFIVGTIWMHARALQDDIFIQYGIDPGEIGQQCAIPAGSGGVHYIVDPFTEISQVIF